VSEAFVPPWMTKNLVAVAVVVLCLGSAGCGRNDTSRTDSGDIAAVVRATERQRLRALLAHDFGTTQKLHADDFELINPLGEVVSREQFIDSGAAFAYTEWKPISPIRVRVYGEAAVIRYESELEIHGTRGHYWHTDLYEKRDGRWQIVWSQTTGAP
jgi:Domain of unknown function (DUF4440)